MTDVGAIKEISAAFPKSATTEAQARAVFLGVINHKYVKGEPKVMDKYPNSDGFLILTNEEQIQIGYLDTQFKTLPPKHYNKPRIQCSRKFLAYCQDNLIPVLLFAVNIRDKKVYWRHMDMPTIKEAYSKIKGHSVSLELSVNQYIDEKSESYLKAWQQILTDLSEKVKGYETLKTAHAIVQREFEEMRSFFNDPIKLPLEVTKELHDFLDCYNSILDREFNVVKKERYPDVWKIGMGVIGLSFMTISYLLYPIPYGSDQVLIKQINHKAAEDLVRDMLEGKVLSLINASLVDIQFRRSAYAYDLIKDDITKIVGIKRFPVASEFMANEYLVAFIDTYHVYLDVQPGQASYDLSDLKFKLLSLLPMAVAHDKNFAGWVTEYQCNIDDYATCRPSSSYKKLLDQSRKKLVDEVVPKVKVTITSENFNMDLIHYYIGFLEARRIEEFDRIYKPGQLGTGQSVMQWKLWDYDTLYLNLKIFIQNFHDVYLLHMRAHFKYLLQQVNLFDSCDIIFAIVNLDIERAKKPYIIFYRCKVGVHVKNEILLLRANDPKNPINAERYWVERRVDITYGTTPMQIISAQNFPLDFMFDPSPTYSLINTFLQKKIDIFLREIGRDLV